MTYEELNGVEALVEARRSYLDNLRILHIPLGAKVSFNEHRGTSSKEGANGRGQLLYRNRRSILVRREDGSDVTVGIKQILFVDGRNF